MTIDIQEAHRIYQAGIELGRTMAKREMEEFVTLTSAEPAAVGNPFTLLYPMPPSKSVTPTLKNVSPLAKRASKTPVVAPTAKKEPVARTKGVKEAILALITADPMSPAAIIGATGFKSTSVRATLMSLKIAGLATNDDGRWIATNPVGSGNSEAVKKIHDRFPETLS